MAKRLTSTRQLRSLRAEGGLEMRVGVDDEGLRQAVKALKEVLKGDRKALKIPLELALKVIQRLQQTWFDQKAGGGVSANGGSWEPLGKWARAGKRILVRTGKLRASLGPGKPAKSIRSVLKKRAKFGTKLKHAALHHLANEGAKAHGAHQSQRLILEEPGPKAVADIARALQIGINQVLEREGLA